jgi:hypothetical protein
MPFPRRSRCLQFVGQLLKFVGVILTLTLATSSCRYADFFLIRADIKRGECYVEYSMNHPMEET